MWTSKRQGILGLVFLLINTAVSQPNWDCKEPESLPPPHFFDDTVDGVVNTDTTMGYNSPDQNWLAVDMHQCLPKGIVYGLEYLQYADGEFSFHIFHPDAVEPVVNHPASQTVSGSADRQNYQYKCMDTPIPVDTSLYGVSVADNTATTPPIWGRVYAAIDGSTEEYPCGQHVTLATAYPFHLFDRNTMDAQGSSFDPYDVDAEMYGMIAVRPIMNKEFRYTCGCSSDASCQMYDCNMKCNMDSMQCACTDGWIYNAKNNKCLQEATSPNKSVTISSPAETDGSALVDGDFATCVTTDSESSPWMVIDLEISFIVNAVNIKIPSSEFTETTTTISSPCPGDCDSCDSCEAAVSFPSSSYPINPCVETVSTGQEDSYGAIMLERVDKDNVLMMLVKYEDQSLDTVNVSGTDTVALTVRSTVAGISEFSIYVSDTFDGSTFDPLSASLCTSVRGYPKHGDVNNVFTCDSPVTGRYVALAPTQPYGNPGNALTICEVQVHAVNAPGSGACETDADCRDCKQTGYDENYYCNLDTNKCECRTGYKYWPPFQLCINRNECADTPNPCGDVDETQDGIEDAICKDLPGSYSCECPEGYAADKVNGGCKDVNECLERGVLRHSCDELCINTFGGYNCSCNEGSYLDPADLTSCLDIDECNETSRDVYGVSEYRCGMYMPGDDGNYAPPNCTNTMGSYTCYCIDGYEYLGTATSGSDKFRCEDIKECSVNNGGCAATCTETNIIDDGIKYKCSCPTGQTLASNSFSCQDIDQCSEAGGTILHDCGSGSNNPAMSNNAVTKALCRTKGASSYECYCPGGWNYNADTKRCEDINECESVSPCMHLCDNTYGSYTCTCRDGFDLLADKKSCQDRNECKGTTHGCEQDCINVLGSYRCGCFTGYTLSEDSKTCKQGRRMQFIICLDKPYIDVYDDVTSSESRALAEQLETNMRTQLADPDDASRSKYDYKVVGYYRCPVDLVGVNVTVLPPGDATDGELASYASSVSSALSASPLTIDGQAVPLIGSPQFIDGDNADSDPFTVVTPCDYFTNTEYCQNGATCQIVNGVPECKCHSSYKGPRCLEKVDGGLSNLVVGMIAAFSCLLLLFIFLGICVCLLKRSRAPGLPKPVTSTFPNYVFNDRYRPRTPYQYY